MWGKGKCIDIDYAYQLMSLFATQKFELFAINYHKGGFGSGHYFSVVNREGDWIKFDDTKMSSVRNEKISSQLASASAYLLFFKKV